MKKVNLKHVGLGIVFVLLVVGIPLIMDKYIIGNNVPSNIDNSDWVSFLGSYIGAVLGGIFTFIGIKVTLYNSVEKKKQEQVRGVKLPLSQRYRVVRQDKGVKGIKMDVNPSLFPVI